MKLDATAQRITAYYTNLVRTGTGYFGGTVFTSYKVIIVQENPQAGQEIEVSQVVPSLKQVKFKSNTFYSVNFDDSVMVISITDKPDRCRVTKLVAISETALARFSQAGITPDAWYMWSNENEVH